jgi:hypothetical protein
MTTMMIMMVVVVAMMVTALTLVLLYSLPKQCVTCVSPDVETRE